MASTYINIPNAVTVASLPLPAGAATSALQIAGNTTLSSIDTQLTSLVNILSTDFLSGEIEQPSVKIYTLIPVAIYTITIQSLEIYTSSGTATVTIKINGVAVTGLSSISVTSIPQEPAATALNVAAPGDTITLDISAISSPIDLVFRLKYSRSA